MAIVVVPDGASPGVYTGDATAGGPSLCDLYAVKGLPPSAWLAISIAPRAGTTVTPDAQGCFLHCLFKWSQPVELRGQRRQILLPPQGQKMQQEVYVETDPGTYWVGSDAELRFLGGTPGDEYEVEITAYVIRHELDEWEEERAVDLFEAPAGILFTSSASTE